MVWIEFFEHEALDVAFRLRALALGDVPHGTADHPVVFNAGV